MMMKWTNFGCKSLLIFVAGFLIISSGPILRVLLNLKFPNTEFNPFPSYITIHKTETHKPSSDDWTLTRFGGDLNFDYSSCPMNSIMLNSTRVNAKPLHDNCPQVFIIGARKGGSTSMYQYLSKHPDFKGILLDRGPRAGETFYFSKRYKEYSWSTYISKFPRHNMTGESSVTNLVGCEVPERLYTYCGRTSKVIVLLRDPFERYQSDFRMRVRLKKTNIQKISTLVNNEVNKFYTLLRHMEISINNLTANISKLLCLYGPGGNCINEGMYYVHLHNWLCNFPAENILILNNEEFSSKTKFIFSQVLDFVGLRPLDDGILNEIIKVRYNHGGKVEDAPDYRLLSSSDKEKLRPIYKPLNEKLFDLLNWHNISWSN